MKRFLTATFPLLFVVTALLFVVSGCTSSVAYTCASATELVQKATAAKDKISPANQDHIAHAVSILNPVCSQDTPPSLDSAARAGLSSALAEFTAAVPQ